MYVGYLQDRKLVGYPALKDTSCGIKLVLITDQTVLLIRNLSSNVKGKSKRIMVVICLEVLLIFGNVAPAEAKGDWFLPGAEGFTPPISKPVQSSRGLGTQVVNQQAGKMLVGVVVEEIQTQVPKVELAVVHQIQLQKLRLN